MSSPAVTVVIPAYNADATIERAVDSVLAQSRPVDQIVVVDDGSRTPLDAVLAHYGERVTLIRQSNGHAAAARNTGIQQAHGDWVAFLDADDYWEPDKLQHQLAVIAQHPQLDALASRFYCQAPGQPRYTPPYRVDRWHDCVCNRQGATAFLIGTMMWTSTVMVRRSVLQQHSFVSGLEPAEDRDLWVRLAHHGRVYIDSRPLATAVLEPTGISRSGIAHDCTQMLRVIQRHRPMLGPWGDRFWRSYVSYRWAANELSALAAFQHLARSFTLWPAPYRWHPTMRRLGRARRAAGLVRSLIKRTPKHSLQLQHAVFTPDAATPTQVRCD